MGAIKICGMKGNIYHITYHHINRCSKEQGMDDLESSPNTKQTQYTLIVSFTKFDVIIESLTGTKINRVKLHKDVKCFFTT